MTIDAARAGLSVVEVELGLAHRPTGRDLRGFLHRGRQLATSCSPPARSARNHRGLRLPLVGSTLGAAPRPRGRGRRCGRARRRPVERARARLSRPPARRADDGDAQARRHPARRRSLRRARSPAPCSSRSPRTRSTSSTRGRGALSRPFSLRGRAARRAALAAVLLAPYDLREMTMLGDAGSNALGAVLGLGSVDRLTGKAAGSRSARSPASPSSASAARSGALIEQTPVLRELDALGRGA